METKLCDYAQTAMWLKCLATRQITRV